MFTAALFTIAKAWKQPKCPSTDELDKENMVYIHSGILLSYKKKSKIIPFAETLMHPEIIVPNNVS